MTLWERPIGRRAFLGGIAAGLAACSNGSRNGSPGLSSGGSSTTSSSVPVPRLDRDPFTLGIASGDPRPDSVVLWTRLAIDPLGDEPMPDVEVPVTWEIATDERFADVVGHGVAITTPALGHSVHVDAGALEPDWGYWYRFRVGDHESQVGRTRTAPTPGTGLRSLSFAVTSCQAYPGGYYTSHRMLAGDDVAFLVFLGDYIYELAAGDVRSHGLAPATTLAEFRRFYAAYKADADLQAAHAALPWIVTWDDHEVEDNYAGLEPGRLGAGDDPAGARAAFPAKRAAAYRAWWEHMPVRAAPPDAGGGLRIHRSFDFGDLARIVVVDGRQHRSPIPDGDGNLPRFFGGGPQIAAAFDPAATMYGPRQEQWIHERLAGSSARWNVFAQQTLVAECDRSPDDPTKGYSMDAWDGYVAARNRLLGHVRDAGIRNFVSLGGDIHTSAVTDLLADYKDPGSPVVGTELVAPPTSSLELLAGDAAEGALRNAHIKLYDPHNHGYLRCTATPERLHAEFRYVSTIDEPAAVARAGTSWEVLDGVPGARQV